MDCGVRVCVVCAVREGERGREKERGGGGVSEIVTP